MSTKLHNLYRITARPFDLIKELTPKLDDAVDALVADFVVHIAARLYVNGVTPKISYMIDAMHEMQAWRKGEEISPSAFSAFCTAGRAATFSRRATICG